MTLLAISDALQVVKNSLTLPGKGQYVDYGEYLTNSSDIPTV